MRTKKTNEKLKVLQASLMDVLKTCPVHYTDEECGRKLGLRVDTVRMLKTIAQSLEHNVVDNTARQYR